MLASVLDPHWLIQISVPAGAVEADLKDRQRASAPYCENQPRISLRSAIVQGCLAGKQVTRYVAPAKDERIRLVGLDWFLPASRGSTDTATTLLLLLRKVCPEALPTRFGTFEPLQHRLDSNDESFLKMWEEVSNVEYGDLFF